MVRWSKRQTRTLSEAVSKQSASHYTFGRRSARGRTITWRRSARICLCEATTAQLSALRSGLQHAQRRAPDYGLRCSARRLAVDARLIVSVRIGRSRRSNGWRKRVLTSGSWWPRWLSTAAALVVSNITRAGADRFVGTISTTSWRLSTGKGRWCGGGKVAKLYAHVLASSSTRDTATWVVWFFIKNILGSVQPTMRRLLACAAMWTCKIYAAFCHPGRF